MASPCGVSALPAEDPESDKLSMFRAERIEQRTHGGLEDHGRNVGRLLTVCPRANELSL
jgi:hypothetical protein